MPCELNTLNISLTSKCNLKCKHCGAINEVDEIPLSKLKEIISGAAKNNVKNIIFAGGEPFVRSDIFEVFRECEKNLIHFSVLTNGTLLNEENIQKLKQFKMLSYIRISLDYAEAQKIESFRGMKGIFEKIENAINCLHKNDIICGVGMTITEDNINEVLKVAQRAKMWQADFFRGSPVSAIGRSENILYDENFYERALEEMLKVHEEYGEYEFYPVLRLPRDLKALYKDILAKCPGGKYVAAISSNGNISRCPLSESVIKDKNIYNSTLDELIECNKVECEKLEKEFMNCKECKYCEDREICKSGCSCEVEINKKRGQYKPICMKKVFQGAIHTEVSKSRRRAINNIIYREKLYGNMPICFRSSPLWVVFLNEKMG